MANICIICSSPGDYDIFAPIPAYLHASPNEFLLWPKHISKMMEETTGLVITEDDILLPRKICALCISYLKHAATFRQQAIDNILNLKTAELIKHPDKITMNDDSERIIMRENQLNFSEKRCSDLKNLLASKPKINKCDDYLKKNFENSPNIPPQLHSLQQKNNDELKNDSKRDSSHSKSKNIHLNTYLNLLFDKDTNKNANRRRYYNRNRGLHEGILDEMNPIDIDFDDLLTGSSDDNDFVEQNSEKKNFFNYKEKNFEEDDILNDILKDHNIIINIPEIHKERKCPACCKRFMFEDSYDDHTANCIEYQLLTLIEEVNRLLVIRRKKTISPHEFVRRMIFSLKKVSDFLRSRGENINIPSQSSEKKIKYNKKNSIKPLENDSDSLVNESIENFNTLNSTMIENRNNKSFNSSKLISNMKTSTPEIKRNHQSVKKKLETSFQTIQQQKCERKQSADSKNSSDFSALQTPSPSNQLSRGSDSSNKVAHGNGLNFNTVLLTPVGHLTSAVSFFSSPSPKFMNFSAKCSICNIVFDTIGGLEEHNAKFHNYRPIEKEEHKKIIALFEDE